MANVAERAGLVPRGTDVWGTSPTRSHEVLVMREGDGWVTWAGRYAPWHEGGRLPAREWDVYMGPQLDAALRAATRFARRLRR